MVELLIIADDFTGALDTGVQFAMRGIRTRVFTDPACSLIPADDQVQVVVVDAETRHLSPARAYDIVYNLTRQAMMLDIPHIFKKTDSGLRGNIGAELTAVMTASGCDQLPFLPAFPQMNRRTEGGIHYIDNTPVGESIFSTDPFEPVRHSNVAEIIAEQSAAACTALPALDAGADIPDVNGILIFDSSTVEELDRTAARLYEAGKMRIMAGCAGLGTAVPTLLGLGSGVKPVMPKLDPRMLVVCGSVNPVSVSQLKTAEANGFVHLRLQPVQKLTEGYFDSDEGSRQLDAWRKVLAEHDAVILDVNDEGGNELTSRYGAEHGMVLEQLRVQIARNLGAIMAKLFHCPDVGTLFVIGGDTLLQCMKSVKVSEMEPIGEIASGVVLSSFTVDGTTRLIISKSGAFGESDLLLTMKKQMENA